MKNSENIFWKIISALFNPIAAPLWAVVLYYASAQRPFTLIEAVYTAGVVAMATIAIPVPVMLVLKGAGKIESLGLRNAYERRLPLLMICILLMAALRFYLIGRVSPEVTLCLAAATASLFITYISLYWDKISLHAMGISGLVCFMFMLMYKWGWPLSAALPVAAVMLAVYDIVVMARMELGRHNWRQIILGTIVGGVPQVLAFALLYQGGGRF